MKPCTRFCPPRARERLLAALRSEPPRLDGMALAIATLEKPDLEPGPVLAQLDALAARVQALIAQLEHPDGLVERMAALRHVLAVEEGFTGDAQDYLAPENIFLPRVLERRKGLPITLSVLYVEVGRRCGLPLFGVSFPGHFLVAAREGEEVVVLDPFHRGRSLDEAALTVLLRKMAPELELCPALLAPASADQIAYRILGNLRRAYLERQDAARALEVVELLLLLEPDHPGELRTRAMLLACMGAFRAALADVQRCLMLMPDAPDRPRLERMAEELRQRSELLN
ncbi:MAG: transglutaminase-like domain-containing protein [Myxococcaceae bacterium]|nr:transglutaminase-like domain-containing protein [Myxococcaceae bacterium]MCI0670275.1 transglutaminase-like domain-containing protein [Myxococcaceae bacterium]